MSDLTAERLRAVLNYDSGTGQFTRATTVRRFVAGSQAGYFCDGYRVITIDQRPYKAHRLAWLYVHGQWPKGQIDHRNGQRDDNRIDNLRVCTHAQNQQNLQRSYRNSRSGLLGASLDKKTGKWVSQIQLDKVKHFIGWFDTAEDAHAAYVAKKRSLHSHGVL